MLHRANLQKWTIAALLILQIAWMGNHLRWVANGQINPWKLGGYGMYTVPNPNSTLAVYDAHFPDAPLSVNTIGYDRATRFTNVSRAFRCADVPAAALLAFFDDNRDLIGKDLAFVYSERQFFRHPPSTKRVVQGEVIVTWQDAQTFAYTNRFCGNEHVGTATSPFEFAKLP